MAKFDRKKFRKELKEKEQLAQEENLYKELENSPVQLFFVKLRDWISKNKLYFFGAILLSFLVLVGIIAWGEYKTYKEELATAEIEKLEKKHLKAEITLQNKIKDYEEFLEKHSTKNTTLRVSKSLADLYAQQKEYLKAAEYMEKSASLVEDFKEIQAFYYYVCGNYRDKAGDSKKALENYQKAANLLGSNKETPNFTAWTYYQIGRLKLKQGEKDSAISDLKKVLEIEAKYEGTYLAEVKQLSIYLILKANKG